MKRIAIDARFYRRATAGAGRYTRGLIHHLQKIKTNYDFTVILTPADYAEWPKDTMPHNWHTKVMDIPHYSFGEQITLLGYLNKEKFDLVHFTQFNHPIGYNRPFVVSILDLIMSKFPTRSPLHPYSFAYNATMRHAAKKAKAVCVISKSTEHDVHAAFPSTKNKTTVTLLGVEPEYQPIGQEQISKTLARYAIDPPYLLFVSAWRPHKGLPELVDAFTSLKPDFPSLKLVIVGKPVPSYPTVSSHVFSAQTACSDIITPGFVESDSDLIALYNGATAFVFPTHYEGFGLGGLEALACGTPTIAAHNSSLPEVLGEASLFYPTGDTHALATTLRTLLTSPSLAKELRTKGLAQAQRFSFDAMAHETLTVYDTILRRDEPIDS